MAYANSQGSGEPARPRSLAWTFAVRSHNIMMTLDEASDTEPRLCPYWVAVHVGLKDH